MPLLSLCLIYHGDHVKVSSCSYSNRINFTILEANTVVYVPGGKKRGSVRDSLAIREEQEFQDSYPGGLELTTSAVKQDFLSFTETSVSPQQSCKELKRSL